MFLRSFYTETLYFCDQLRLKKLPVLSIVASRSIRGINVKRTETDIKLEEAIQKMKKLYKPESFRDLGLEKDIKLYTPPRMEKRAISKNINIISKDQVEIPEVTVENQFALLADKVTPYHTLSYDIQLKKKYAKNKKILKSWGKSLHSSGSQIAIGSDKMPCVLDPIIPSPITEYYRNKDEFSIRCGVDGNEKTVGFFLQSPSESNSTFCVGPDKLNIIKDSHKLIAKEFEHYICMSDLPACYNFDDGGYWRNIIVRSNSSGDLMTIVIIHPRDLSKEQIEDEKMKLKEYFTSGSRNSLNIKSLFFQTCVHTRCTHAQSPFQLLYGEPYIMEEISGCKFRLSPESFFQINTLAAEQLYKVVSRACLVKPTTTLLDLCCGVGPISLLLAPHVKNCIGIDSSEQAIEDARMNAEINNIKNIEFYAGRVEYVLEKVLNNIYAEDIVVVINPARSSLNSFLIQSLRECKFLHKIVFVTCKPEAFIANFDLLCRPFSKQGHLRKPFYPARAVPVDIFPQTDHCELVIVFQRL